MLSLASALQDLWTIANGDEGPSPADSVNSIDNHCRGCLDDQLLGATAQLFGKGDRSVLAILRCSFQHGIPKEHLKDVDLLREQLLRHIEWHIEDYTETRRLPPEQIAEYATEIAKVCIEVFRKAQSSKIRELSCYGAAVKAR